MCKAWQDQFLDGRSQERKDMIANMLSSGKSAEEISSFVGIPLEEGLLQREFFFQIKSVPTRVCNSEMQPVVYTPKDFRTENPDYSPRP